MDVGAVIAEEMEAVAREHQKTLPKLTCNLPLIETGLDSLCFATLVARLEDRLRVDPFATADEGRLPITIGDFVAFYKSAVVEAIGSESLNAT